MRVGLVVVVCVVLGLAGCSGGVLSGVSSGGTQAASVAGARLTGVVHGGQQPLVGAHVYLLAAASGAAGSGNGAGAAAYGGAGIAASATNASVSLMTTGTLDASGGATNGFYYVTTDGSGNFAITGDYSCMAGQQVYLYVTGGDPGVGSGVNPAAGLMAALGNCPGTAGSTGNTFSSGLYIVVNEVSTVAAAYAMAGFATDATHVGSSGTALALTGIQNAFANAGNLETLGTGVALATTPVANGGNGTVPQAELNTLGNILAACVNSSGAGSTGCSTLFVSAKSGGSTGTVATDTATAAINIAHNPAANVATLYGLAVANPPFAGGLTAQPNDWTVGISFAGGGLNGPVVIAIDGLGNAWVVNNRLSSFSVSEFSSVGVALSPSTGYTGGGVNLTYSIAIDTAGNAWIANYSRSTISELSPAGVALSPAAGYTGGGLFNPRSIAIDGFGVVWAANFSNDSVSAFSNLGTALSPTGGYTAGMSLPYAIGIDGSGNAWVANDYNGYGVSELSNAGAALTPRGGYTAVGVYVAESITIDGSGSVWAANQEPALVKFSNTGVALSPPGGYSGGGLGRIMAIAMDGSGNLWAANFTGLTGPTLSEFSSAGVALSASTGYAEPVTYPEAVAIDGSGNVWVADYQNRVFQTIGAATPVITPICAGLPATPTVDGSSKLGTRP